MVYRRDSEEQTRSSVAPACALLRSKGMYVTGRLNPGEDDPLTGEVGDGHCWCNKTQNVLGPDDALVERERCVPGRDCYQPGVV
ncbi:MAG: hypothetical protein R3C10_04810 [Pirellulales bacterium]